MKNQSNTSSVNYLLLGMLLLVAACDPAELPDPIDNGPSYFTEMELDGDKNYWGSGKDEIYNFSSYERVRDNALRFSSMLQRDTCNYPCPSSFRVDLYSHEAVAGSVDPVYQFRPGARRWEDLMEQSGLWWFNAALAFQQGSPSGVTTNWYINGAEVQQGGQDLSGPITDSMRVVEICAQLQTQRGSKQLICHRLRSLTLKPLQVALAGTSDSSAMVYFKANAQFGKPPYRYFWNGLEGGPELRFAATSDTFGVHLRVLDAEGNELEITNHADLSLTNVFSVNAQMKLGLERRFAQSPPFGRVALRWVDKAGNEFSTAKGPQLPGDMFRVEEVQLVRPIPTEPPMAKVTMRFAGTLYDGAGGVRHIDNGKATMLFRFPG